MSKPWYTFYTQLKYQIGFVSHVDSNFVPISCLTHWPPEQQNSNIFKYSIENAIIKYSTKQAFFLIPKFFTNQSNIKLLIRYYFKLSLKSNQNPLFWAHNHHWFEKWSGVKMTPNPLCHQYGFCICFILKPITTRKSIKKWMELFILYVLNFSRPQCSKQI